MVVMDGTYVYKEAIYKVIDAAQMKNPVTREWMASVVYINTNRRELGVFVRDAQDFKNKFQLLEDELLEPAPNEESGTKVEQLLSRILAELEWMNEAKGD